MAEAREIRIVCCSDVRQRMRNLAEVYHRLILRNEIVCPEGIEPASYAIRLMQDAFKQPPVIHPPLLDCFPTHCWSMNILDVAGLSNAAAEGDNAVTEYVARCTTSMESMWFAFVNDCDGNDYVSLHRLGSVLTALRALLTSDIGIALGRSLTHAFCRFSLTSSYTVHVFNESIVSSDALHSRLMAWLLGCVALFGNEDRRKVLSKAIELLLNRGLGSELQQRLATFPTQCFESIVNDFQMLLTVELLSTGDIDSLSSICALLSELYTANFLLSQRSGVIPYTKFYNGFTDDFSDEDIRDDYIRLLQGDFAFARFPFLLNVRYKSVVLQLESSVERDGAFHSAMISNLMTNRGNAVLEDFFLVLRIDRSRVVDSTLREVRRKISQIRRPLRVQFIDEEGVDEGGLKKEFFQLLTRELLHPNYNMFYEIESTKFLWFVPSIQNSSNRAEYFLIGQVIGLAVYNNIIIDVAFPMAVFRKLLSVPVTLEDLLELDPPLHRGLVDLLEFAEDDTRSVEDVFCRSFVYQHEVFGECVEVPIVPGGAEITLTAANRNEFVNAVCEYVLNTAASDNFNAFREGFLAVCARDLLTRLRPEELEMLVCGGRVLDFNELKAHTVYEGYTPEDEVVLWFWSVVDDFSDQHKKKILRFCTGSDRIPVGGLKDLHFVVGKNGDDSELLPTSHTCFNHLLLPAYGTQAKLRAKLLLAIDNCEGFFGGK